MSSVAVPLESSADGDEQAVSAVRGGPGWVPGAEWSWLPDCISRLYNFDMSPLYAWLPVLLLFTAALLALLTAPNTQGGLCGDISTLEKYCCGREPAYNSTTSCLLVNNQVPPNTDAIDGKCFPHLMKAMPYSANTYWALWSFAVIGFFLAMAASVGFLVRTALPCIKCNIQYEPFCCIQNRFWDVGGFQYKYPDGYDAFKLIMATLTIIVLTGFITPLAHGVKQSYQDIEDLNVCTGPQAAACAAQLGDSLDIAHCNASAFMLITMLVWVSLLGGIVVHSIVLCYCRSAEARVRAMSGEEQQTWKEVLIDGVARVPTALMAHYTPPAPSHPDHRRNATERCMPQEEDSHIHGSVLSSGGIDSLQSAV